MWDKITKDGKIGESWTVGGQKEMEAREARGRVEVHCGRRKGKRKE